MNLKRITPEKEVSGMNYLVSLLMGVLVGVIYAAVHVKSPAPPLIALIGLLGMVIGEMGYDFVKQYL